MIACAKAGGGVVHTPNGLPIRSIRHDGNMYEHGHGDHPDYKFPVEIEYVGGLKKEVLDELTEFWRVENPTEEDARRYLAETHALIYTDGSIAVTLYECNYSMFSLRTGECLGGRYVSKDNRLSEKSREEITRRYVEPKSKPQSQYSEDCPSCGGQIVESHSGGMCTTPGCDG